MNPLELLVIWIAIWLLMVATIGFVVAKRTPKRLKKETREK